MRSFSRPGSRRSGCPGVSVDQGPEPKASLEAGRAVPVEGAGQTRFEVDLGMVLEQLAGGWFVPVSTLLDHITAQRGEHVLTPRERAALENKWLWHKLRHGES